ncbi:MAG: hybrid sensor histidine kinase/response regulator [Roseiflexaceae bacterium]|nr:hybrid sensor histidine kinase/response regulator [Roseiflexaceae bacterium]
MDLTTFYIQFRDETVENLRALNDGLVALEAGLEGEQRKSTIDAVFRAMHTIKGSARLLGLEPISRIAHTCEYILGAIREGQRTLTRTLTNDLLRGGDAIMALVNNVVDGVPITIDADALARSLGRNLNPTNPEQENKPQADDESAEQPAAIIQTQEANASPAAPVEPMPFNTARTNRAAVRQTIRVRVDRLDRLLNLAGELKIGDQTDAAHLQNLAELTHLINQQSRSLISLERELSRMRFSATQREVIDRYLNDALTTGKQANTLTHGVLERFRQYANQSTQIVEDLEQEVMAARLLQIGTLFSNLPRAVRELAHELGREVALELHGEATELDRKAIEALSDPLTHLLRNAIDHGIEPPDQRERAGKPRQGTVTITAQALGTFAQIIVRDDGRGIDPQQARAAAIRKGLLSSEAVGVLTNQEAIELVFMPGFSTARMITDVSGRGVGMDVVRTNMIELGGQVQIESQLGKGSTITLNLPLSLVTTRVLLAEVGDQLFGLPASGCHGVVWVRPERVRTIEGRAMLPRPEGLTPLLRLDELLGVAHARHVHASRTPALLIGTATRPIAMLVDRLLDEREVVIKPLGPLMERQRRYSGGFQLGDGRLILLLNPLTIAQMTRGMALAAPSQADVIQRRQRLLVADDSFATRELIRSILSSAGYDVATAVDGIDALDKLRADPYDLVVTDVEMPRLDGFQLTQSIRTDLNKTDLPVVIITSLASETHRRRGLEAGAQAYIVKSQFNQSNLIDTIRQLLGG